jgi:hypothetical protein
MSASKAHFAFVVSATLASCLFALLTFLAGFAPVWIGNVILSRTKVIVGSSGTEASANQVSGSTALFATVATVAALFFIYRFAIRAIRNWDGPITVNVNELVKQEKDNSLSLLALAEMRRLITLRPDPIASEAAVNWKQKQSEAPSAPPWHELARSLFEVAFDEASFNDNSWRDQFRCWVGEMFVFRPGQSQTSSLILFVFDDEPAEMTLISRIRAFAADGGSLSGSKLYAVFDGPRVAQERSVNLEGGQVELWPRQALLRKGIKLSSYAANLIKRFDTEVLGGTKATLRDTFVEPHVHKRETTDRKLLSEVLSEWLSDPSRRHLAITGEYGQGKSTAMLEFCVKWARRYLQGESGIERIPLLIELRGHSPAEAADSLEFLSAWAARYGMAPQQVYNLIKSGDAIVIFEGFDELRNAGRAYDRHEHFNALWRMAFPGTKLVFTGRPNFFLDEKEKNRTLRSDIFVAAAGGAFTQVWEMDRLTTLEVNKAVRGFGEDLGRSIMDAATSHPAFFEIVSRPSMLPVVATIWNKIQELQNQGLDLTSAVLMEYYFQAMYRRKEEQIVSVSDLSRYLLLPHQVREVFTLAIVWKMVSGDARNTINRKSFDGVIAHTYDDVLKLFQTSGVPPHITERVCAFEVQFRDENKTDMIERVANEVASAGLFVPDPAGGAGNLGLPHKQFYEYLIAKASWLILAHTDSQTSGVLRSVYAMNPFQALLKEEQSLIFFLN